jgi:tetratricopeptide (TPR) repeat protein
MRAVILSLMLSGLSPLVASAADRTPFEEGQRLLRRMEDARAADAFRRALAQSSSRAERARILVHLGIAHCNLLDWTAAEQAFRRALAEQPDVPLPAVVSPHTAARFERLRASASRPASGPTTGPAATLPASAPAASRPVARVVVPRRPPSPPPPARRPWRQAWGAWVALGVAAAAAGSGLGLGLSARSEDQRANDLALLYEEAMPHYDRARSRAIAADVLFGVAAAAAVVSAALIVRHARERARAPRVVGGQGIGLQVGAAAW